MKIGIFDSGMGELSVLHRALRMIPEADFSICGRGARPIWGKTREQVRDILTNYSIYDKEAGRCDCDCLQYSYECGHKEYRSQFPLPIVGMEPAVKKAVERIC